MHIEQYTDLLRGLNETIWRCAETKHEERQSAAAQTEILEQAGYRVERGVGGMETAFLATLGSGRPVIGLLSEYDALDGLSQQADLCAPCPRPETTKGHGCGHNLLGTGVTGAALLLRDALRASHLPGTIRVYGCPGEEGGSGKGFLARAGLFDDLDIALTWHPSTLNAVMTGSLLANIQVAFRFRGVSAHAGAFPQLGRSALDAVELMNVGVNYLREHMEMTDRVHYAVTDTGGFSPNVVPSHAEVLYLIRSRTAEGVQQLYNRVCRIAEGAALMTGTTVETTFESAVSQVIPNHTLAKLTHDVMARIGVPQATEEERAYLRRFQALLPPDAIGSDSGQLPPDYLPEERRALATAHPDGAFLMPFVPQESVVCGSSDMGDASCFAPLVQVQAACFALGTAAHSWHWVAQGTSSFALRGACYAARVLAETALTLLRDPEQVAAAQAEFHRRTDGQPYVCPIPPDAVPRPLRA